jgi:thiosulfate/3-mercaptopyruvate sulfurtransferase
MTLTTLISTSDLAAQMAHQSCALIDCRFMLDDVAWGRRQYEAGHIPGAVYAHIDDDLSGPKTGTNGRHPLPSPDALRGTFSRLGIDADVQVVAYDQDNGMYASRLWWLLRWMGHDAVAVLDGGFAQWTSEGRPVTVGVETRSGRTFSGSPRNELLVDADAVEGNLTSNAWLLMDARAPERFRGDVEPIDRVAGHIPGAVNVFYKENLDERGLFRAPADLRARLEGALDGRKAEDVVAYCGSGVTACHNVLALEHAGLHGARLYAGSWSEWSSDAHRPIATGP